MKFSLNFDAENPKDMELMKLFQKAVNGYEFEDEARCNKCNHKDSEHDENDKGECLICDCDGMED